MSKSTENVKLTSDNLVDTTQRIMMGVENASTLHLRLMLNGYKEKAPTVEGGQSLDEVNRYNATPREQRPVTNEDLRLYMIRSKRGMNRFDKTISAEEFLMEMDYFIQEIRKVFAKYLSPTQCWTSRNFILTSGSSGKTCQTS